MTFGRRIRAVGAGPGIITVIVVLVIASGWVVHATADRYIASTRDSEISRSADEARAAVLALRETVSRTLDQIDALNGLASLVVQARHAGNAAMERETRAELALVQAKSGAYVLQVSGILPSGDLDWSTLKTPDIPIYVGDRDYFRTIADGSASTFISAPLMGRLTQMRSIKFSKGFYDPNGALLGVTVVSVQPVAFSSLATIVGVTSSDSVTLQRQDGMVLARKAGGEGTIPRDWSHMNLFLASREGTAQGPSAIDGVLRRIAWQRLDDRGLIVVVGLDMQARLDRLEPAARRTREQARITILLIALAGAGAIAVWFSRRRAAAGAARMEIIRESESVFRQMAESLPDMIRLLDRRGVVLYANPAARELLGIEPEALIGHDTTQFVHPGDVDSTAWLRLLRDPERRTGRAEIRMVRPDGRTVRVQSILHVIGDDTTPDGAPRLIVSSRDVTRQRAAEAALRSTKEELDTVLRAVSGALFRYVMGADGELEIVYVSDSIEAITGFLPAECLAPRWHETQRDPAFDAARREHVQRLVAVGSSTLEFRFRHKNGSWLWLQAFARGLREDDRQVVVGCICDVTRQRERTQQTAHNAKMAMLGEMTTGFALELSRPLAAIGVVARNGLGSLNTTQSNHPFIRMKLQRIVEQADRASSVIDRMRIFRRQKPGEPENVRIATVIEGACRVVESRLLQCGIDLVIDTPEDLPLVKGHPLPLEQVLINLIGNAIDATAMQTPDLPRRRRRVDISTRADGQSVIVVVADHAGGISDAVMPRLFEPFFTTKPTGSGTGLGLSISYGIVAEMGGTITARNAGDGARFEVRLPAANKTREEMAA